MRRLREDLVVIFSYLMGRYREDGARVFPEMNCEMTRDFATCSKRNLTRLKEKCLHSESKQILQQATQRVSGISIFGDAQNATGLSSNLFSLKLVLL